MYKRQVPWPPTDGKATRIGMGTANYAGQLAEFARAVCRARPDTGAEVVMAAPADRQRYPADLYIEPEALDDPAFQRRQAERVDGHYTHLIADAFRPVFGWRNDKHIGGDLPALRRSGVPIAILGHGSEIRRPRPHLERHEHSLYRDVPPDRLAVLTSTAERNRRIADEGGVPVFVTTPDLLDDVPHATWTPLVVDLDRWHSERPIMERAAPVVVHAPSARWTKSTGSIVPVLEELHVRKAIEFRLVEGVPHGRMLEEIQDADIVVDQLAVGSYGTLACEAMAAGRPVIAYIGPTSAEHYGRELPVVNATPDTLGSALASLLDDRERTRRLGRESRRYVGAVHDGRLTAERLGPFLDARPTAAPPGTETRR
ncbi:hypothetical protein [Glycomyces tenuis]|uniref:hypothetical protein n=1 Tax=Glycomyces tenuis TaxID=58116 RepID=UPI00068D659B|nr:hypothetical protein [Glycomyces tenuis]